MTTVPCPLCGYHAPEASCPHCSGTSADRSLARPRRGPLTGVVDGAIALPTGLAILLRTRGLKRWLVPPLLLTSILMALVLWQLVAYLNGVLDSMVPDQIVLGRDWAWLSGLSATWAWLKSTWVGIVGATEWILNTGLGLFLSARPLAWFLLGSLVAWYCFSIAYEALAGPFLDEVQGRLEAQWFGGDPRSSLERPNDIPTGRCALFTGIAAAIAAVLGSLLWPMLGAWAVPAAVIAGVAAPSAFDRRYLGWALWVARVEGRALWTSLQATALTGVILVIGLPLYFVPVVGYFLFAMVAGCATAIGLLDIPLERRGWTLGQRARFIARHGLPFIVFGIEAGFLLAVPVIGPVLMVPAASLGGLWLLCRLDKGFLRRG